MLIGATLDVNCSLLLKLQLTINGIKTKHVKFKAIFSVCLDRHQLQPD